MRGDQQGAKKSVPRLRWFPLRANPAARRKEATKSRRIRDEESGPAGLCAPCAAQARRGTRRNQSVKTSMKHNKNHDNAPNAGPQLVPVRFEFTHATAITVCVAGTFNHW